MVKIIIYLTINSELDYKVELKNGFKYTPSMSNEDNGGYDASIVGDDFISVAGGIGAWKKKDIDPGLYPRMLL